MGFLKHRPFFIYAFASITIRNNILARGSCTKPATTFIWLVICEIIKPWMEFLRCFRVSAKILSGWYTICQHYGLAPS